MGRKKTIRGRDLKAPLLFAATIAVATGLAVYTSAYQKAHPPQVRVLGMCIPESRVSMVSPPGPSGPFGLALSQMHLDKTSGAWVTVYFTPREMMKAVPGWTGYRWDRDIHFKLRIGLVVGMSADVPLNSGRLTNATRQIYALKGPYKDARVSRLGDTGLYKVETRSKPHPMGSWALLWVNPRDKNKPPVEAWRRWDAAMCFYPEDQTPTTCGLNYATQGVTFDVWVDGKNILLTRKVEAFLSRKVHEWRSACHAKS